jgi:hypothetical protein
VDKRFDTTVNFLERQQTEETEQNEGTEQTEGTEQPDTDVSEASD